jgi:hypothetical protein
MIVRKNEDDIRAFVGSDSDLSKHKQGENSQRVLKKAVGASECFFHIDAT